MRKKNQKLLKHRSLLKEITLILIIKLILIFVIYHLWFNQPIRHPENSIEQHLLGQISK
jgi:hypothetical protein